MAIARGTFAFSNGTGSSTLTYSVTVPSYMPYLVVVAESINNPARSVTGITFGGVALTRIGSEYSQDTGAGPFVNSSIWELVAPTPSTADVVVTAAGNSDLRSYAQPYSGVAQSSVTDGSVNEGSGVAASNTGTVTTTQLGSWAVMMNGVISGQSTASTNATVVGVGGGSIRLYDSSGLSNPNYISPPGAFSMTADNTSGSVLSCWVMKGIKAFPYVYSETDSTGATTDTITSQFESELSDSTGVTTDTVEQRFGWSNTSKSSNPTWTLTDKS